MTLGGHVPTYSQRREKFGPRRLSQGLPRHTLPRHWRATRIRLSSYLIPTCLPDMGPYPWCQCPTDTIAELAGSLTGPTNRYGWFGDSYNSYAWLELFTCKNLSYKQWYPGRSPLFQRSHLQGIFFMASGTFCRPGIQPSRCLLMA